MPLKVKCIGISIGICNIGPTFTWYQIDTRICGMEQPMVVFSTHAAICGRAGKNVYKYVNKYVKSPKL